MATPVKHGVKHVKPILSLTPGESRNRVLALYKTWYRQIPIIVELYDLPKTEQECKRKLKELFRQNKNVRDLRTIDMLLIKGQMELQETVNQWKPCGTLLNYWNDTVLPKPKDFMSKFLSGHD
ncbi:NADH dehydrogenase [ubiquinone] 1 alpha subcomplex subunit 6 [Anthophora quadrimaculata]